MTKIKKHFASLLCALFSLSLFSVPVEAIAEDNPILEGRTPKFEIRLGSPQGKFTSQSGLFFEGVEQGGQVQGILTLRSLDDVNGKYVFERASAVKENDRFGFYPVHILDSPIGIGSWITLDKEEIEYDGYGSVEVPFTIDVPETASPGDYYGSISGIFVAYLGEDLALFLEKHPEKKKGNVALRVASMAKIGLSIAGEILMDLMINDLQWGEVYLNTETLDNDLYFNIKLLSKSSVVVQPLYDVKIFKGDELMLEREAFTGKMFYTDDLKEDRVEFQNVPEFGYGHYKVVVGVQYANAKDLFGWKLENEERPDVFIDAGKVEIEFWILPWFYIFLGFGFVAFILLILLIRALLLRREQKRATIYKVQQGDNLEGIVQRFSVDAKKVVKLNSLKAPYFLQPGKEIFIPNNQ